MVELLANNIIEIDAHLRQLGWTETEVCSLNSAGEGNMNRVLRAQLADGNSIILKQALDHVAKYPQIPAPIERANVEAQFYVAIEIEHRLAGRMPRLIGYDAPNYLLCLQDLGEGRDFIDAYQHDHQAEPIREQFMESLSDLLSWLSCLHAFSLPVEFPRNQAMRALNHEHIFEIPLRPTMHQQLGALLRPRTRALANEIAQDAVICAKANELGRIYLGDIATHSQPVLLHGDFYPGSWLRDRKLAAFVIDPEFAFVGPAEFDIGVFMAHLTFAGIDRAAVRTVLREYVPPPGFDSSLALRFAGIELIRRLLGVAQLPVSEDDAIKVAWLNEAKGFLAE